MSIADLNKMIKNIAAKGGGGVQAAQVAAPAGALAGLDVDGLRSLLASAALSVPAGSCGCSGDPSQYEAVFDGYLPVAGAEVTVGAAGTYTVTINVQGRPVKGSRLFMAQSAGIFSVTQIKLGNNDLQFGGYVAGFALNPANQNGNGIEITAPDDWFSGLTSIQITGAVSAGATLQAQLMSNDPSLYNAQSCGPMPRFRRGR